MSRRNKIAVVAAVRCICALMLLGIFSVGSQACGGPRVFTYWREELLQQLRATGVPADGIWSARRSSSADALVLIVHGADVSACSMVTVRSGQAQMVAAPGVNIYPGADGRIVAWMGTNGDEVHFAAGGKVSLPRFALFDLDPEGHYFIIGEKPLQTWVGRVARPEKTLLISTNLLGDRVFAQGSRLYVCGGTYRRDPSSREAMGGAACLVVQDDGETFRVEREHDFPWAAGVVDMDAHGDRLLIQAKGDFSPKLYLYDLKSRVRTRVGTAKAFNCLLLADPFSAKGH